MQSLAKTTVVVLAGGLGTRLRSKVYNQPKILAEVQGKPFLTYLLDQVSKAGFHDVVLCTGYLGDQVKSTFGERYRKLHISYSQELTRLDTAGALRLALPQIKSDLVLVFNGDSYCGVSLDEFWQWHVKFCESSSIVLVWVSDTQRYGRVEITKNGTVLSFEEKGKSYGEGWINAGIYILNRSIIRALPSNCPVSLERYLMPKLLNQGLQGYTSFANFIDIGTPESYEKAQHMKF